MSSTRKPSSVRHAWAVVALGLAGVAGYGWGSVRQDMPQERERSLASKESRRGRAPEVRAESPVGREFVQAVIEGSVDERQQWRHVGSFTEAEVKSALAELEKLDRYLVGSWDLRAMLFYRWAEFDPVAANAAAKEDAPKGPNWDNFSSSRQAVIAAWINQGGAVAAWDAVREEREIWACTRTVPREVSDMLVASLSDRNDLAAMKEALRFNDEEGLVAGGLVVARAGRAIESPESRAAFLAAAAIHPDPWIQELARELLFKEWAEKDVPAARAGALALSLDEESRESLGRMIDRVEEDKAREAKEDSP